MPELPEVEAARRAAQKVAAGRRIVDAHVADDPIVFEGVAPARFRRALADGRRLGRIRLRQDPPTEPPISALGFDAWRALPTPVRFHAMLRERKSPIKAVLLDQAF